MKETNCENILTAMTAVFDGEETEFSPEQLNAHLAGCQTCRAEIEQTQNVFNMLQSQRRREQDANLWFAIENRIGAQIASSISLKPFVLLGLVLAGYKLLELLPAQDFGLAFKIVPLIFVVALFVFIKENPFKINARLAPEK